MMKIHVDTDIGGDPDDLCAIAMLLKWPDVQIAGITTVAEDKGRRAGYARYVLKLAGREDIPVKAGADVAGGYFRYEPDYPDELAWWPEAVPPSPNPVDEALELLSASIEQGAIIVGIGQYTNLRLLEEKYPGILMRATIYLMGGCVYPVRAGFPQWTNDMDYNIQLDAHSAKFVLEHSDPTLVPLSVSVETALRGAYLPALRRSGKIGELIATQTEAQNRDGQYEELLGKTCTGLPSDTLNFQHDPLACAIALGWDGATIEEVPLGLELRDGLLHETVRPDGKPTRIVTRVDGEAFNRFWLDVVTR
jgi:purine nucleosidase